ncbi:STAS domain-containing protein [Photorhabdus laumondii subsp. laumondii]|uniref:Photorhabdus luminescens subsp. laumondii TTO1 complete genome segment 9/17 n=2 Tax=Photorhabdus laumondii subsp. laumondii TaxID=141679 RepID=Q7N472_PHOLL|nr:MULTISPECIES: SulP family inorganic anion transporter [Photorhabdus]AWK42231.1 sulfate permease [Photorhabdus laumondii subsp. laumondii]AXG43081.1 SulP family inorganic anion transporter [Photorhabdus laumondii subsp. laumondii]AXG47551.1 SulP family inorganic anion transporter [Photorhabdus laumondii subsp. laumondii]KTL59812.1 sulfate permease [Photorhabdus laumondii subsp. laumondii]MCC8385179.1 SulP family inorganic anion transporter [Photorhabdus laumondii]
MQWKKLQRWMPGLGNFSHYRKEWFSHDLRAGLSVAAVALPVAIAYAELMGISAIIGLYACILPMFAYALFGTSRQLIVGPDAATCAVIAAAVAPLVFGNEDVRWQLTIVMTLMTGIWCVLASHFRLGAFADFLSKPILKGLMNGVALTIIVDQLAKVFGFAGVPMGLIERVIALPAKLMSTHLPTLAMSVAMVLILLTVRFLRPTWPGPLLAMVLATYISWQFDLEKYGVQIVGSVSGGGLPVVPMPDFQPGIMRELVIPSLNLAVISFVSFMMTARSFASKNGYQIDADCELRALGIANIASALSQGFAVSAASSRTAVNDTIGGKTQLVSVIAATIILLVLLFMTRFLAYIPLSSLGVVLIYSASSLLGLRQIWSLRKRNHQAFTLSLFTFIAVLVVGLINGVGFAVLLGLLQFLRIIFRPTDQLLGVNDQGMIHSINHGNDIKPIDGVMMYRFNSPLTYFNVSYFKKRVLQHVDRIQKINKTQKRPGWLVVDAAVSFTHDDVSVFAAIDELISELKVRDITLVLAGRRTELTRWIKQNKLRSSDDDLIVVPDLYFAVRMIQSKPEWYSNYAKRYNSVIEINQ